ncbi:MAG: winged helix DNA-binding protein [Methanobrevibacter sp.]|nr:winged helix DNA-binding protein [Methanobrevibacter sp.]
MNDETIAKLSFIKSSKHRENILHFIGDEIKISTEIARNINISSKHISKYLRELKDENIIVCLNENDKRGRLYKLTPLGKEILKYL